MQEDVLFKITNGLYVLSSPDYAHPKRHAGSLIDALSQVAINPTLLIISCMNNSYTKECIEKSGLVGISILADTIAPALVANFGFQSSRNVNKWANTDHLAQDGLLYLNNCLGKIRAQVIQTIPFACNTLFIAEVKDAFDAQDGSALTYGAYRHSFKNQVIQAWKHQKEHQPMTEETKHWTCTVCNYVYDGEIPFEELPEDWLCPLCGVGKEFFELR